MNDWKFCQDSLIHVSRTFSRPIEMLPEVLQRAVTCSYLLCRIVDTIEDDGALALEQQDLLYNAFLDILEREEPVDRFLEAFETVQGTEKERLLAKNIERVLRVLRALPSNLQDACTPWVTEMTRGMAIYSHRKTGADGFVAVTTLADLERYCYFVAGTVGHLLTALFLEYMPPLTPANKATLETHAEAFGLGLQFTNILKDVTDDRERGWSFVPRSLLARYGLSVSTLTEPADRATAHAALAELFDRAEQHLSDAFTYCMAIPSTEREIRLFCLLPLWMAVRTLAHARGNDAQLTTGAPVKISRREVSALIQDCVEHVADDRALQARFAALRTEGRDLRAGRAS